MTEIVWQYFLNPDITVFPNSPGGKGQLDNTFGAAPRRAGYGKGGGGPPRHGGKGGKAGDGGFTHRIGRMRAIIKFTWDEQTGSYVCSSMGQQLR